MMIRGERENGRPQKLLFSFRFIDHQSASAEEQNGWERKHILPNGVEGFGWRINFA